MLHALAIKLVVTDEAREASWASGPLRERRQASAGGGPEG